MKKKKTKAIISTFVIIVTIVLILIINISSQNCSELKSISSKKQLEKIYNNEDDLPFSKIFIGLITPFALPILIDGANTLSYSSVYTKNDYVYEDFATNNLSAMSVDSSAGVPTMESSQVSQSDSKDYSTTNIQVENVDEADITKTDGDYIYSISENNVIITDVRTPEDIKIVSKIYMEDEYPEDLILYNDKLVIISTSENQTSYYSYYSKSNTMVNIYDIKNKENPRLIKNYTLYEDYYTSRCINNKLYVISSGRLRKENDDIITYYKENESKREISLKDIKYFKDMKTNMQTLISYVDLDDVQADIKVNSYLIDISNAYVSQDNIYLLDYDYENNFEISPLKLYGLKGVFGLFDDDYDYNYDAKTKIYKFNILNNGTIKYDAKTNVNGKTINQFSIDEYKGNLRVALSDSEGSRISVFDKNLKMIGETESLAQGEKMYSSRFLGDKAYLVTYKTVDPLYVIDLSEATNPKVLGKLKIPGYSTYLHPYDENHLIGIGMETEEKVYRDSFGKVTSTIATITGMKMALFDVSDVNNPIQISNTIIGDSRATSAILTNHKALLFSKEKELLAIPVNNYEDEFSIETESENYEDIIDMYTGYGKNYVSEGYFVYNLNIQDGFKLKGIINHDANVSKYSYGTNTKLLRGLYIDDNLYTVSESTIKVNKLKDLEQVDELKIIENDDTDKGLIEYFIEEDE